MFTGKLGVSWRLGGEKRGGPDVSTRLDGFQISLASAGFRCGV